MAQENETDKAEKEEKSFLEKASPLLAGVGSVGAGIAIYWLFEMRKDIAGLKDKVTSQQAEIEQLNKKITSVEKENKELLESVKKAEEERKREESRKETINGILRELGTKQTVAEKKGEIIRPRKEETTAVKHCYKTDFLD
jgi:predicted nuclease with TOPRIM domain